MSEVRSPNVGALVPGRMPRADSPEPSDPHGMGG